MDKTAASFRSAEASFVWDQYPKSRGRNRYAKGQSVLPEERQRYPDGRGHYVTGSKYVLVADGKIEVYQPRIDQVTVYDPGKNRDTVESFMVLGFGGGGHDMLKSFDVKYLGT